MAEIKRYANLLEADKYLEVKNVNGHYSARQYVQYIKDMRFIREYVDERFHRITKTDLTELYKYHVPIA